MGWWSAQYAWLDSVGWLVGLLTIVLHDGLGCLLLLPVQAIVALKAEKHNGTPTAQSDR